MKPIIRFVLAWTLAAVAGATVSMAQTLEFQTQWALADQGNDIAAFCQFDDQGNRIVFGSFSGEMDFNPNGAPHLLNALGNPDLFLASYDEDNLLNFAFSIGRIALTDGMVPKGLVVEQNGDIVIAGSFRQTVDFNPGEGTLMLTSAGGFDAFLIKYNAVGELIWGRSMGSQGYDAATALEKGENGQYYYALQFSDSIDMDFGPDEDWLISQGSGDAAIVTWSAEGFPVRYAHINPGANNESITAMRYAPEKGLAIGMLMDGIQVGGIPHASLYLALIDTLGEAVWEFNFGNLEQENEISQLEFSEDGESILVAGRFRGITDFNPGEQEVSFIPLFTDVFIARYDAETGNLDWANHIESEGTLDYVAGIWESTHEENRIMLTGAFDQAARFVPGDFTSQKVSAGGRDIFMAAYDFNEGTFLSAETFGGAGDEFPRDVHVNSDGDVLVVGSFGESLQLDEEVTPIFALGFSDAFVALFTEELDTSVPEAMAAAQLKVFPNPVESVLQIQSQGQIGNGRNLRITNVYGSTVIERKLTQWENRLEIDVSQLSPGVYIIETTTTEGRATKKFIKL